ncbi:hypothetical protein QBC46DRAFT_343978 [Diplogelasinospora grovesii]|uniref:Rhodopsin domain-containing protein n=1 Tax=Diplogelasinospora grovesii TaxID=303347 RepID=A0AAN6N2J7_9PEZI|nr:hypothetical protein QBC46DRAFT_343978 [Diplogelasinospora grovesii]
MFTVGILSIVISIARTQFINEFTSSTNVTCMSPPSPILGTASPVQKNIPTYSNYSFATDDVRPVAAWSLLEIDVGIICACLPSIQALLRSSWESAFDSSEHA